MFRICTNMYVAVHTQCIIFVWYQLKLDHVNKFHNMTQYQISCKPIHHFLSKMGRWMHIWSDFTRYSAVMQMYLITHIHQLPLKFLITKIQAVKYFMTKSDHLLICVSLNPGRTVGWFGGAGSLGGGGARMLDREVEPGGNCGAGRRGLIGGLVLDCNGAQLLPRILDCPAPTTRFIMGPMQRKTGIKNNHQHQYILQVKCERVTSSKYNIQYPQTEKSGQKKYIPHNWNIKVNSWGNMVYISNHRQMD